MTSNAKWKNNFKDFFFEKGAEGAEKLKENSEETLSNGCKGSEPRTEDLNADDVDADQTNCESVTDASEENDCLTDDSKSLLENNPPSGTLKGRLFRMFNKPADKDDEGVQTVANDHDKTLMTNGRTNQVQMVDKAVSTEDKDDIPQDKEGGGSTESSEGSDETAETVNESKVEEKKRFRFQLFSK